MPTQIRGNTQILAGSIDAARLQASFNLPISQIQNGATLLRADGSVAATAPLPMGGNRITGLGTPTQATDAATKAYADSIAQGLDVKPSVRVCIDTHQSSLATLLTGDGVALAAGNRVLLIGQATPSQNGFWVANAGAWTRPSDYAAASTDLVSGGTFVFVEEGTNYADTGWVLTTNGAVTVDTTATAWTQFSGAGSLVAGAGLTKTGNSVDVGQGNGISVTANAIAVLPAPSGNITVDPAGVSVTPGIFLELAKLATLTPQDCTGTVNGINVTFSLPSAPLANTVSVYLNGLLQKRVTDYTISGSTITFVTAPQSSGTADWVAASYIAA